MSALSTLGPLSLLALALGVAALAWQLFRAARPDSVSRKGTLAGSLAAVGGFAVAGSTATLLQTFKGVSAVAADQQEAFLSSGVQQAVESLVPAGQLLQLVLLLGLVAAWRVRPDARPAGHAGAWAQRLGIISGLLLVACLTAAAKLGLAFYLPHEELGMVVVTRMYTTLSLSLAAGALGVVAAVLGVMDSGEALLD